MTRDEQAAGQIDEMLAKLEFTCDEAKRIELLGGEGGGGGGDNNDVADDGTVIPPEIADNGFAQMEELKGIWTLMGKVRSAVRARVDYLKVRF